MLNTINNNSKTVINTPATGIIQKSDDKSFFLKFHQDSAMAKKIFNEKPEHNNIKVLVLQIMLINEGYLMVECIRESDFNLWA